MELFSYLLRWWVTAALFVGISYAAPVTNPKAPATRATQITKADKAKKIVSAPVTKVKAVVAPKLKKPEPVKSSLVEKKSAPKKIEPPKSVAKPAPKTKSASQKTSPTPKSPVKTKPPSKIATRTKTRPAPPPPSRPEIAAPGPLRVIAPRAMVVNENTGEVFLRKNGEQIVPIASVTKLMTGMVILDRNLSMEEEITITDADVDRMKHSSSRLQVGTTLSRRETLLLALMSSENRAAASLGRTYPGGMTAFVAAMNRKAQSLGMNNSYFADPTGLDPENASTAEDLVKMVRAALRYPTIQEMTTTVSYEIGVGIHQRPTQFINTNRLVRNGALDIGLSKTGYIQEAGHCLVMQVIVNETPTIMVFLGNSGKYTCQSDAIRVSQWLRNNVH